MVCATAVMSVFKSFPASSASLKANLHRKAQDGLRKEEDKTMKCGKDRYGGKKGQEGFERK